MRAAGAQTLIGESTAQAKQDAHALVGEAMAECEKLLRAAGQMNTEAIQIREKSRQDHRGCGASFVAPADPRPGRGAAHPPDGADRNQRDAGYFGAHDFHHPYPQCGGARAAAAAGGAASLEATEGEGLKNMARKLTQRPKKVTDLRGGKLIEAKPVESKGWEMKTLLAAVENSEPAIRDAGTATAAAMGALQLALADMAVDLEAIDADAVPGNEEWKRYLAGDRAVFARKLASAIDDGAIDRITTLYREDERFHDAANSYLNEFEALAVPFARKRQRRHSHLVDPVGGYRQDLSRHRVCARAAIAHPISSS